MTEKAAEDKGPLPRRIGVGLLVGIAAAFGAYLVTGEFKRAAMGGAAFFFIAFLNGAPKRDKK